MGRMRQAAASWSVRPASHQLAGSQGQKESDETGGGKGEMREVCKLDKMVDRVRYTIPAACIILPRGNGY